MIIEKRCSFSYMYLLSSVLACCGQTSRPATDQCASILGMAEWRVTMREGIHPDYYQAKVVCNCGNEFVTGSTKEEIHVEICSKCHSFYTGQQKAVKARGAIDKFNRRYGMQSN